MISYVFWKKRSRYYYLLIDFEGIVSSNDTFDWLFEIYKCIERINSHITLFIYKLKKMLN